MHDKEQIHDRELRVHGRSWVVGLDGDVVNLLLTAVNTALESTGSGSLETVHIHIQRVLFTVSRDSVNDRSDILSQVQHSVYQDMEHYSQTLCNPQQQI